MKYPSILVLLCLQRFVCATDLFNRITSNHESETSVTHLSRNLGVLKRNRCVLEKNFIKCRTKRGRKGCLMKQFNEAEQTCETKCFSNPNIHPLWECGRCNKTRLPTNVPVASPTTKLPTETPSSGIQTTKVPTKSPSSGIQTTPTKAPSNKPSSVPSNKPSSVPSNKPSSVPSNKPSSVPSNKPSSVPSNKPSSVPSNKPSSVPSNKPSLAPTSEPSELPSTKPSAKPSSKPSAMPSRAPVLPSVASCTYSATGTASCIKGTTPVNCVQSPGALDCYLNTLTITPGSDDSFSPRFATGSGSTLRGTCAAPDTIGCVNGPTGTYYYDLFLITNSHPTETPCVVVDYFDDNPNINVVIGAFSGVINRSDVCSSFIGRGTASIGIGGGVMIFNLAPQTNVYLAVTTVQNAATIGSATFDYSMLISFQKPL